MNMCLEQAQIISVLNKRYWIDSSVIRKGPKLSVSLEDAIFFTLLLKLSPNSCDENGDKDPLSDLD